LNGFSQESRYLYLVMEFVRGGELFTYLRGKQFFPLRQAQFYAAQIFSVFAYLHSNDIIYRFSFGFNKIYRDLKPENVMIADNGYLKLTDFGFAKVCTHRTYTLCGTPEYLAPEIILNKGHGKPVDWWTFGVFTYELLVGIDPFTDDDPANIYRNILSGKVTFPSDFDMDAKSLIKRLLQEDLTKRLGNLKGGTDDIKNHKFFKDINWDDLHAKKIKAMYIPPLKYFSNIA